jgi:hypothetical protein
MHSYMNAMTQQSEQSLAAELVEPTPPPSESTLAVDQLRCEPVSATLAAVQPADGLRDPRSVRGGTRMGTVDPAVPSPSGSPSGRALDEAGQASPVCGTAAQENFPTEAALLAAADFMFLSGTGAVVALGAGPAASKATVGLLVRV